MKTPEQIAAETAKKIVPILANDSYLSYREDAAKLILAALTEHAKGLEEERDKLVKFYDEIVAAIGHDRIINEYNQRGRMLSEETNWRKEAEAERDQLRTELARLEHENSALITQADQLRAEVESLKTTNRNLGKFVEELAPERDQLRARVAELEARILADNKAYGCELRDPNGTIWEYAETLKKRVAELELQTFDIKKLEADKERLDWLEDKLCYAMVCLNGRTMESLANKGTGWHDGQLRAAIDAARTAQPAANTGDNHRMEDRS